MLFCGDRLAELREDKKLSQKQLAQYLEVTVPNISEYENNKTCPSLEKIIKIARYFDVSLDYLCGLTDDLISYKRENCVVLPREQTALMKQEIMHFIELVKNYYRQ